MSKEEKFLKAGMIFLLLLGLKAGARVSLRRLMPQEDLPERAIVFSCAGRSAYEAPGTYYPGLVEII